MSKRLVMFFALQLVAISIGISAAFYAETGRAHAVYGANHCTRYSVTPAQVDPPDCYKRELMPVNTYQTPSFGWRDQNHIGLNANRWWTIYLFDNFGGTYEYYSDFGLGGTSIGVTSVQTKALCSLTSSVGGVCNTLWHD